MKWILFILLPFFTFSQLQKEDEKKINIDSLLQTEEYQGIEIEKHTVKKGERMKNIYMKYKINPGEIYRLNPEAKDSLKVGSVILIPLEKKFVYREWLNPKWVAQNKKNILEYAQIKDSLEIAKRLAKEKEKDKENESKRLAALNKNEKSKKDEVKSTMVSLEDVKITAEKIKEINKKNDLIRKKNMEDFYAKLELEAKQNKIKDSIEQAEIVVNKSSNKDKKKIKKEIKFGTPNDHNVTLDPKNKENYILHEIEEGETLFMIAKKYKIPDFALLEFNKRVDFNKVLAGNLMKVPDINKKNVQSYIFDLIGAYKNLNIKYDKEITKKKFAYFNEDDEEE
jgi:LysM repeat protein